MLLGKRMDLSEFTPISSEITENLPSKSISLIDEKDTDCMNLVHLAHGHRHGLQKALKFQIDKRDGTKQQFIQNYKKQ